MDKMNLARHAKQDGLLIACTSQGWCVLNYKPVRGTPHMRKPYRIVSPDQQVMIEASTIKEAKEKLREIHAELLYDLELAA